MHSYHLSNIITIWLPKTIIIYASEYLYSAYLITAMHPEANQQPQDRVVVLSLSVDHGMG